MQHDDSLQHCSITLVASTAKNGQKIADVREIVRPGLRIGGGTGSAAVSAGFGLASLQPVWCCDGPATGWLSTGSPFEAMADLAQQIRVQGI